jgi:O-acetyl-ADP-ribose deacetylase (regulator of RNase III)
MLISQLLAEFFAQGCEMLTYIVGNLLDSETQVLVNAVNTVGVMGKGIALEFKQRYPDMFEQYQQLCKTGQFSVGQLWLYKSPAKWILNFPTKQHWKDKSRLEYIEVGLQKFVETYREQGIESIAFPQLGCGYGGLDWETQVYPLMEQYLSLLPITVYVYSFKG